MDKNRMADDKKITFSAPTPDIQIHRLVGKMPPLMRDYGFLIINAALECVSGPGGYRSPWRSFEFYSLSHLIGGAGRFQLHGEERFTELKPGDNEIVAKIHSGSQGFSFGLLLEDDLAQTLSDEVVFQ